LRFKNDVNNHEHGKVNLHVYSKELPPPGGSVSNMIIGRSSNLLKFFFAGAIYRNSVQFTSDAL